MDYENLVSREKKTLGYKQCCDEKRATYQKELAVKEVAGKFTVYLDACGFCAESFRTYVYAPKGEQTFGLIAN